MQSHKNQKIIWVIITLLIVFLGLSCYIFVQNNSSKITENYHDEFTNFFELSALISSNSADDVALVYGAKELKPYLENFRAFSGYQGKSQIFKNPEQESYYGELTEPITLNSGFRLLLNFDNQTTDSEIIISGKESSQENNWWQDIHQLRIGYNKEEKGYYISLLNGQKEGSAWYQILENTKPGESLIFEFTNFQGESFLVKNMSGQILTQLDLTETNDLQMAQGLFPYSSMKIGINLPPDNGRLKINQLLFFQI